MLISNRVADSSKSISSASNQQLGCMKTSIALSRPTQDQKQICFAGSEPIGPRKTLKVLVS
ncbi:hypothetical protein Plhal710r2_c033g0122341 [Plasmopara halstedii]